VPSTTVDGRAARAQRTRDAVVRALLDLVRDGYLRPTAREIAERAGISLRSVYVHFDDLDDLFAAAVRQHLRDSADFLDPVDATLPLPARVRAFAGQRGALYDQGAAVRRAATVWAPTSAPLREALARGRRVAAHDTARLFADAIAPGPDHDARLEAIDAAGSAALWDHLRYERGLDEDAARTVVAALVTGILEAR
jgi:AcrR family transcriptional regulator